MIFNLGQNFLSYIMFFDTSPINFSRDFVVVFIPFSHASQELVYGIWSF